MTPIRLALLLAALAGAQSADPGKKPADSKPAIVECDEICPGLAGCVPQEDVKKIKHVFYSCKVEQYCLPKCPKRSLLHDWHDDCHESCPVCKTEPHCRHRLVKTVVTEHMPVLKCKVQYLPKLTCEPDCPVLDLPLPVPPAVERPRRLP